MSDRAHLPRSTLARSGRRSLSSIMSPPQTPTKPRRQEIIDLDSSPEQGPLPSTSTLTPGPPPESPLTRARAQIVYGSPASRGALSPSKPHPFHQSPVHPSFLDKGKQPDFTASRADRLKQGESVVYPLHRPPSPNKTISSERVKKFRGQLPVREMTDDKENEPAIRRVPSGSCSGTGASIGKGKGKGKAAAGCGLKEFNLADDEWGKPPMVVYSRSREEVEELVGCLKGSVSDRPSPLKDSALILRPVPTDHSRLIWSVLDRALPELVRC